MQRRLVGLTKRNYVSTTETCYCTSHTKDASMNGDNGYKKTIGKHSTSNCSLRFKLYVGSYIYVKNDLQFETNGVADGASHTNTRIINSSVVWLYGRTHPWTFVGRPSDHGCIAIIIDAGQNFFRNTLH
jgi:hypothetical protein